MKKNIKLLTIAIISLFISFPLINAAAQTGLKIDEVNFTDSKLLMVTICNWDRFDVDMGDYQLLVSNGSKRVTKTFTKDYVLNYACAESTFTPEEIEIDRSATFDIRTRLESTTGKKKDEKNVNLYIELEDRFIVPDDPFVDIIIKSLDFNETTKTIKAQICNQGENYKISYKYGLSTKFSYNNTSTKTIYQEKQLWADQCWDQSIELKQLKLVKPGTYTIEVLTDAGNAIEEKTSNKYDTSKEDNNRDTIEVTIAETKQAVKTPTTKQTTTKQTVEKKTVNTSTKQTTTQSVETTVKKTVKSASQLSLRDRIAAKKGLAISSRKTSTTQKKTRTNSNRRSKNYKPSKSRSSLEAKYPYLFR